MAGIDLSKLQPWDWSPASVATPTATPTTGNTQSAQTQNYNPVASTTPTGNYTPAATSGTSGGADTSWLPEDAFLKFGDSPGQWYRSNEWGGQLVWHPYWGWQKGSKIRNLYQQSPNTFDTSEEDIKKWNLKQNLGTTDWRQAFETVMGMTTDEWHQQNDAANARRAGQAATLGTTGTTGTAGTTGTTGDATMAGTTGTTDLSSFFQSYYPEYGQTQEFNYPNELNQASDVLGEYAYTGRPTDWTEWYQKAKGTVETDVMDQIKQAAEKAGLGGTRWSTPMGRTAQDISSRAMQNLGTQFMGYQNTALENAANRGLTAAQALTGVAQQRQDMPVNFANASYNMGQGMTNSYNSMLSSMLEEWKRTLPENSPWLQYAAGLTNLLGNTPQTYQPSICSQILGAGTQLGSAALL